MKKMYRIEGQIVFLRRGECAIVNHAGGGIRTSTVLAIHKDTENLCVFETRNSVYSITAPADITELNLLPACA